MSYGDRVQFTAPDRSLGDANRDLTAIESIAPDGRILGNRHGRTSLLTNAVNSFTL
jgi:hypothetical protein